MRSNVASLRFALVGALVAGLLVAGGAAASSPPASSFI
ncbi:MAG: hypothetical protein QOE84_2196, partial [Actinomycetota bacterium]|nr:hypothetical protein [Actinomycetota bacterium]